LWPAFRSRDLFGVERSEEAPNRRRFELSLLRSAVVSKRTRIEPSERTDPIQLQPQGAAQLGAHGAAQLGAQPLSQAGAQAVSQTGAAQVGSQLTAHGAAQVGAASQTSPQGAAQVTGAQQVGADEQQLDLPPPNRPQIFSQRLFFLGAQQ